MSKLTEQDIKQKTRQGALLLQRGKHNRAIEILEPLLEKAPDNFDGALNLSAAYIMAKKFKEAIPILEKLAQIDDQNPMLWTNLGAAYLGNPVLADDERQFKAVRAFSNALEIDPKTPNVAYNIGLIHKDRKEFDVAIQWFEMALRTDPSDKDAQYWIDEIRKQ